MIENKVQTLAERLVDADLDDQAYESVPPNVRELARGIHGLPDAGKVLWAFYSLLASEEVPQ